MKLKHELEKMIGPANAKSRWVGYEIIGCVDDDDENVDQDFR